MKNLFNIGETISPRLEFQALEGTNGSVFPLVMPSESWKSPDNFRTILDWRLFRVFWIFRLKIGPHSNTKILY